MKSLHTLILSGCSLFWTAVGFSQVVPDVNSKRAKEIYYLCSSCHGAQAEGNITLSAPRLVDLPAWYIEAQVKKFQTGVRGKHPKDYNGMKMAPMARMFKEEDIALVSEYITTLPKTPLKPVIYGKDASRGEILYATCMACHGNDGKGNKDLSAPPLIGQDDWYLKEQLIKFKTDQRGQDAVKDPFGYSMVPMSKALATQDDIDNVVDYISALQGLRANKALDLESSKDKKDKKKENP